MWFEVNACGLKLMHAVIVKKSGNELRQQRNPSTAAELRNYVAFGVPYASTVGVTHKVEVFEKHVTTSEFPCPLYRSLSNQWGKSATCPPPFAKQSLPDYLLSALLVLLGLSLFFRKEMRKTMKS